MPPLPWYTWPLAAIAGLGIAVFSRKTKGTSALRDTSTFLEDPKDRLASVTADTRESFIRLAEQFHQQTGLKLRVRSGRRTCAEQAQQWAIGRTAPGEKVTFAKGCRSWHVLGRAVDADPVGAFPSCDLYTIAGEIWENMGGRWGGRFPGFGPCGDSGHFEWHPGLSMEALCPDPDDCEAAVGALGRVQWIS